MHSSAHSTKSPARGNVWNNRNYFTFKIVKKLLKFAAQSGLSNWKSGQFSAPPAQLTCPKCGLHDLRRNGHNNGAKQRWLCNSCGYRFSNIESLKGIYDDIAERRISVSSVEGTKNLVKVETKIKDWLEGATKNTDAELKTAVFEY